ncbi:hypothetical protein [Pedobacter psychroterrae]|uniref:Uncharacterized protein n=1 Tax=Pedobacter psychroterrae TaxID=2530453 RepID=A0A4R0NH81_9SPHI|nr:hypothetical protein [Pedobacter psychroterrae]TCC99930.1 hypothetical protein EZ437_16970 [Pedobacter psychroterrae]
MNTSWQKLLLPFFISGIGILAIIFMLFFFVETNEIQKALAKPPTFAEKSDKIKLPERITKWNDLYALEKFTLSNRYYHAQLLVRSRMLTLNLSFLTGITLAFIGAIFILGKFSETPTDMCAGSDKISLKILSGSPGIILSILGVILICFSISSKSTIDVTDAPTYIHSSSDDQNQHDLIENQRLTQAYYIDSAKKAAVDSIINSLK